MRFSTKKKPKFRLSHFKPFQYEHHCLRFQANAAVQTTSFLFRNITQRRLAVSWRRFRKIRVYRSLLHMSGIIIGLLDF
jgi:hypothetical protein